MATKKATTKATTTTAKSRTTTKKAPATTRAAAAKKTASVTKKPAATTKKAAARKTNSKAAPVVHQTNFFTVRPTIETAYWLVFGMAILALGVWVLNLTIKINAIYDQIDINQATVSSLEEAGRQAALRAKE